MFFDYTLAIIVFLIIPTITGLGVSGILFDKNNNTFRIASSLLLGYILIWCVIELLSIPVAILKASVNVVYIVTIIIFLIFFVFGIYRLFLIMKDNKKSLSDLYNNKKDVICFVLLLFSLGYIFYKYETSWFFDADDSRFIGNAVDILKSGYILSKDPTTGLDIKSNYGDFQKDIVSHWSVFLAFCSKITRIHVSIFSHTIYPIVFFVLLCSAYWVIMDEIKLKDISTADKSLVLILILALYSYGAYSQRNAETFAIIRSWQGKATLANIGVLLIIWTFIRITRSTNELSNYILLFGVNISLCFMSSMGIVIAAVMIGIYAIVVSVSAKSIKVLIISTIICIPNVLLYLLSQFYSIDRFLN